MLGRIPRDASLLGHFARAILSEAVSSSRVVCQAAFDELDIQALLEDVLSAFEEAHRKIEAKADIKLEVIAADVMNRLIAMLHFLTCIVSRAGTPPFINFSGVAVLSNMMKTRTRKALQQKQVQKPSRHWSESWSCCTVA